MNSLFDEYDTTSDIDLFIYKDLPAIIRTGGQGLTRERFISGITKPVVVKGFQVVGFKGFCSEEYSLVLQIHFDDSKWDINKLGLIYPDEIFLESFKTILNSLGIESDGLIYSEMLEQGSDYVSLDIKGKCLKFFSDLFDENMGQCSTHD